MVVAQSGAGKGQDLGKCLPVGGARRGAGFFGDGALPAFLQDKDLTFNLHGTVTFFSKLPHISFHLTHCPSGFEVSQAGGGLPIVKIKK